MTLAALLSWLPLQAADCGELGGNYTDAAVNGSFWLAFGCPYEDQVGQIVFPTMVFGAIGLAMYIYTGSIIIPLVLAILVGSVILVQVSAVSVQLMGIVVILVMTAGLWILYQRLGRP